MVKRTKNIYTPHQQKPYRISRSKIELYIQCKRCFYLDRRCGISRPRQFPFNLNNAVDTLLKKEFDVHRAQGTTHPLLKSYGIKAIPYQHDDLEKWRENFTGISYFDEKNNFIIFGAVDDVWRNEDGELIIVDYKATSRQYKISIDAPYQQSYKRQLEIYQWLFSKNGYSVSQTGYFVYCNGLTDRHAFDAKLEFDVTLHPFTGNIQWIEDILAQIKRVLDGNECPINTEGCEYCEYVAQCSNTQIQQTII